MALRDAFVLLADEHIAIGQNRSRDIHSDIVNVCIADS